MIFAVTDIETTGESTNTGAITELCVKLTDGSKVLKSFTSLLNPMRRIQPSVVTLTGITDSMVANAPTFAEVAAELHHMYSGAIFVAHNVNFDFRFIQKAFEDIGYSFNPSKMCTVKTARKAFPGLPSYSLGKLCDSIGIDLQNRHRAEGDTDATIELFNRCKAALSEEDFKLLIHGGQVLPPHLNTKDIKILPETPGIYRFINDKGKIKYIGKATNIRKRVLQHFGKNSSRNDLELEQIHSIEHLESGSELHALLHESNEIDAIWPEWNILGKKPNRQWRMVLFESHSGLNKIELVQNVKHTDSAFIFKSKSLGESLLNRIKKQYGICVFLPKFAGKFCNEDCYCHQSIAERITEHNAIIKEVWDYLHHSQEIDILISNGRTIEEKSYALFKNGCLHAWGYSEDDISEDIADVPFQKNSALAQSIALQYLQHAKLNPNHEYKVFTLKKNKFQLCI